MLAPARGESVLDVTLGLGGHAEAFLKATGPTGTLIGCDADGDNLVFARQRLASFGDRVQLHHVNFGALDQCNFPLVDIVFADLGLSSPHLDDASRGFSFRFEGPLDLRFDRTHGKTAAELIQSSDVEELTQIFRLYGELHKEGSKLGRMMAGQDLATTTALKALVEKGFGHHARAVLPQVFQALRIAVNDELNVLATLLRVGPTLLKPGGRMGVISFHSLEDRMVKHVFRELCEPQKDLITGKISVPADFELFQKKALQPSDNEVQKNQRARSAKFRAIRRVIR